MSLHINFLNESKSFFGENKLMFFDILSNNVNSVPQETNGLPDHLKKHIKNSTINSLHEHHDQAGPHEIDQEHHDEITSNESFHKHFFDLFDEYAKYHPEAALKLAKSVERRCVNKVSLDCNNTARFYIGLNDRIIVIKNKIDSLLESNEGYVHNHSLIESIDHTHNLINGIFDSVKRGVEAGREAKVDIRDFIGFELVGDLKYDGVRLAHYPASKDNPTLITVNFVNTLPGDLRFVSRDFIRGKLCDAEGKAGTSFDLQTMKDAIDGVVSKMDDSEIIGSARSIISQIVKRNVDSGMINLGNLEGKWQQGFIENVLDKIAVDVESYNGAKGIIALEKNHEMYVEDNILRIYNLMTTASEMGIEIDNIKQMVKNSATFDIGLMGVPKDIVEKADKGEALLPEEELAYKARWQLGYLICSEDENPEIVNDPGSEKYAKSLIAGGYEGNKDKDIFNSEEIRKSLKFPPKQIDKLPPNIRMPMRFIKVLDTFVKLRRKFGLVHSILEMNRSFQNKGILSTIYKALNTNLINNESSLLNKGDSFIIPKSQFQELGLVDGNVYRAKVLKEGSSKTVALCEISTLDGRILSTETLDLSEEMEFSIRLKEDKKEKEFVNVYPDITKIDRGNVDDPTNMETEGFRNFLEKYSDFRNVLIDLAKILGPKDWAFVGSGAMIINGNSQDLPGDIDLVAFDNGYDTILKNLLKAEKLGKVSGLFIESLDDGRKYSAADVINKRIEFRGDIKFIFDISSGRFGNKEVEMFLESKTRGIAFGRECAEINETSINDKRTGETVSLPSISEIDLSKFYGVNVVFEDSLDNAIDLPHSKVKATRRLGHIMKSLGLSGHEGVEQLSQFIMEIKQEFISAAEDETVKSYRKNGPSSYIKQFLELADNASAKYLRIATELKMHHERFQDQDAYIVDQEKFLNVCENNKQNIGKMLQQLSSMGIDSLGNSEINMRLSWLNRIGKEIAEKMKGFAKTNNAIAYIAGRTSKLQHIDLGRMLLNKVVENRNGVKVGSDFSVDEVAQELDLAA